MMSNNNSTNEDDEAHSQQQQKFTVRDAVEFEYLIDNEDELRAFVASFRPGAPGFPQPVPNADDAISVLYRPQFHNYTTQMILVLKPNTVLLPRGAIQWPQENQGCGFIRTLGSMLSHEFAHPTYMMSDRTCWGCHKEADEDQPYCWQTAVIPSWTDRGPAGILKELRVCHYYVCPDNPRCRLLAQKAIFDLKKDQMGLHQCMNCQKEESKPLQFQLCPQCKITFYCSRECQTEHWPQHKKVCQGKVSCNKCEKAQETPHSFMKREMWTLPLYYLLFQGMPTCRLEET